MASKALIVQARIPQPLKRELGAKLAEQQVTTTEFITNAAYLFLRVGKWWDIQPEEDVDAGEP